MKSRAFLKPLGYLFQIFGGGGFIVIALQRYVLGLPDSEVHIAFDVATIGVFLTGTVVVIIADWLKALDERITALENTRNGASTKN